MHMNPFLQPVKKKLDDSRKEENNRIKRMCGIAGLPAPRLVLNTDGFT